MSDLFQEEAVIFKEKINYKLPGAGGDFYLFYFIFIP